MKQNIGTDVSAIKRSDTLGMRNMVFVLVYFLEVHIFYITKVFKTIFDIAITTTDIFKIT